MSEQKYIHFQTTFETTGAEYFPRWETVMADGYQRLKTVLLPFLRIDGALINSRYAGLSFCLIAHTLNINYYVDYQLLSDGRCRPLRWDGFPISSTADQAALAQRAQKNHGDLFYDIPESSSFLKLTERARIECTLETGIPTWAQSVFGQGPAINSYPIPQFDDPSLDFTEGAKGVSTFDFFDTNQRPMEFVCATYDIPDIFGYYYLFYSPSTKLIRQYFQCT